MRCASVSIGVIAYDQPYYRSSTMRLQHAATDAEAFHRYASTAWSDPNNDHISLIDAKATLSEIERTFDRLASAPPLDLLLVYLSGHGEVDAAGNGWFCLVDARQGKPSLGTAALNSLLARVKADRVFLLIDCCHAETLASGMPFFARLDGNSSRIFVASARSTQRAWEHDSLRRSLFSDVLLRALSTDSRIADSNGQVDLEAKLVPYLRKQVPLSAVALKRGIEQTPVSGGQTVVTTLLPCVTSRSLGRELSVAETAKRRARQWITVVAVIAVATVFLIDALTYHLAVSGSGDILVRPGLRWTYGLVPFHLGRSVETDAKLSDLNPLHDDFFADLGNGSIAGYSGHMDEDGLRPWHGDVSSMLRKVRRASAAAMAAGKVPSFDPDYDMPPLEETAFLSQLRGEPPQELGRRVYPLVSNHIVACNDNPRLNYNFDVILGSPRTFEQDAAWIALTAPQEPAGRSSALLRLTQLAAYRAFGIEKEGPLTAEFDAFASAVWALQANAADHQGFARAAMEILPELLQGWCLDHARLALAAVAEPERRGELESEMLRVAEVLLGEIPAPRRTRPQVLAYRSLVGLGARGLLGQQSLSVIEASAAARSNNVCGDSPTAVLINAVAQGQPLPDGLVRGLRSLLAQPESQNDHSAVCALAVLAANGPFLTADARRQLIQWTADHAETLRTQSSFHRGLGFMFALGDRDDRHRDILVARLSPASRFPPETATSRGVPIISPGDEDALVGLGRLAQVSTLPNEVIERLANAAIGRASLTNREVVIKGLATAWYRDLAVADLPAAMVRRFESAKVSAQRRFLEVEAAASRSCSSANADCSAIMTALLASWKQIDEPEIRIAIARTISLSVLGGQVAAVSECRDGGDDFTLAGK